MHPEDHDQFEDRDAMETPLIVPPPNSIVAGVDGGIGQLLFVYDIVKHQRVGMMAYSVSDA